MIDQWEHTLQDYRAKSYLVLTREELAQTSWETIVADIPVSQATQILLHQLADLRVSLWDAFVHSIQRVHPHIQEDELFTPLKYLLERATQIVVVYGEERAWKSPDKWSYLVEIANLWHSETGSLLFRPPATLEDIRLAETVSGFSFPPTFVRFLRCTNGLGLDPEELSYILGAGKARAFCPLLAEWGRPSYHEIASEWWRWHDLYAYERERDQEEGITADRSGEQIAIPFAHASDDWCFDSSKPGASGEYPVFYWDHEQRLREEGVAYPSFEAWFLDSVVRGNLWEEEDME